MLKRFSFIAFFCALFLPLMAQAQLRYIEGQDYAVLSEAIEQSDKPKVIEFFWFGCPHCNSVRPATHRWLENLPEDVEFEFVPAVFDSRQWQVPAQAYYTMKVLDVDLFDAYFDEVFDNRNRGLLANLGAVKKFFLQHGVSPEEFDKAWDSFEVKQQMQRAERLFAASGLTGVPNFVVNGRYVVAPTASDGYKRSFEVIDALLRMN